MMNGLDEYFDALNRLIAGAPARLSSDAKINKDNVALEAGRGRGSIKKSRPVFYDLIEAIEKAAKEKLDRGILPDGKAKEDLEFYKSEYEKALARELSLVVEVIDLRRQLAKANSASLKLVKSTSE
ncbi:hypothetical protein IB256_21110 [Pseudomonas sp. PDM17]|uniref:hypothetical protein n=1 Tax=Pseudomonas sp. PDM17 TaxID=2769285 RepID=UPI00177E3A4F|nr:hypothetical protein [Pseudomonas sp. PDM17]MBD9503302.1 hypothetical protein [Pseudomonas sp. PDM17]